MNRGGKMQDKESNQSFAVEAVDTLEQLEGTFNGFRRAHAKGQCYQATFTPNGEAIPFTTAAHFQEEETSAIVRFSNSSPNPTKADILSPVKGMAVQFQLPDGEITNLISVTIPIFVAKTPETFIEMVALLNSKEEDANSKEELVKGLVEKYPESVPALKMVKEIAAQPPTSFSTCHYYPIHAFYFINMDGEKKAVKYEWVPDQTMQEKVSGDPKTLSNNYLTEELDARLANGAVGFNLVIHLGEDGDNTNDSTQAWPKDRRTITIGHLSITDKVEDQGNDLLFDPTIVPSGIELSDDPILNFRHDAYAVSFDRRSHNH